MYLQSLFWTTILKVWTQLSFKRSIQVILSISLKLFKFLSLQMNDFSQNKCNSGEKKIKKWKETLALRYYSLIVWLWPPFNNISTRESTNAINDNCLHVHSAQWCFCSVCEGTHTHTGWVTFITLWGNIKDEHIYKTLRILGSFHDELKEYYDTSQKNKHFVEW